MALTVKGQDQSFFYDGRQSIVYGRPDVNPVSPHALNTLKVGTAEQSMSVIGILQQLSSRNYNSARYVAVPKMATACVVVALHLRGA